GRTGPAPPHRSGRSLLTVTGGLDVGHGEMLSSMAAALRSCGAAADVLDRREIAERFPGFALDASTGVWSPDTGVLAAADAVRAMLEAGGVSVRRPVTVTRIDPGPDSVTLETSQGPLRARRVIVTAGGWNGPLLETAGMTLPLQVTREQIFYFRGGEGLPVLIERAALFRYMVPPLYGAPGAKVGEHTAGERTTADGRSFEIDPEGEARVADWVREQMPALEAEPVAAETCLYTMTPDEDFIIDLRGPLAFASPCSGHGFKFAPLIGEILAALATDTDPPVDLERFRAGRFGAF
ncbi:MAG TPA: FAD-dependent oxidoreductase, partial [Actinomycetota bacterium]|nr:FAD-dependent oxidoreductase [Actinomycetota bacterium]